MRLSGCSLKWESINISQSNQTFCVLILPHRHFSVKNELHVSPLLNGKKSHYSISFSSLFNQWTMDSENGKGKGKVKAKEKKKRGKKQSSSSTSSSEESGETSSGGKRYVLDETSNLIHLNLSN